MKKDLSISMVDANRYAFFAVLPFIIPFCLLYIYIWGKGNFYIFYDISLTAILISVIVVVLGFVVHEIIHGLTWQFFARKKSSLVKYGIDSKTLSPYAHCQEPMRINPYRLGVIMPGILLGFLPTIAGIITGNSPVFVFGLLFIVAAGGDILILWLLRNINAECLAEDHPTRVGCYIIDPKDK